MIDIKSIIKNAISILIGGFITWLVFTSGMNGEIKTNTEKLNSKADKVQVSRINERLIGLEDYKSISEPTRIKAIAQLETTNHRLNTIDKRLNKIEDLLIKLIKEQ